MKAWWKLAWSEVLFRTPTQSWWGSKLIKRIEEFLTENGIMRDKIWTLQYLKYASSCVPDYSVRKNEVKQNLQKLRRRFLAWNVGELATCDEVKDTFSAWSFSCRPHDLLLSRIFCSNHPPKSKKLTEAVHKAIFEDFLRKKTAEEVFRNLWNYLVPKFGLSAFQDYVSKRPFASRTSQLGSSIFVGYLYSH